ncbi:L-threonylcarbamoyladenylate synthase [Bacteroidota bacterium]
MGNSTEIINIEADEKYAIESAYKIFKRGGIFIYPTDTIYGFGCDPFNKLAMNRLNNLKVRVSEKQYILLINSLEVLKSYSDPPKQTLDVLNKIWPAAISVILKLNYETKKKLSYSTAAFRIPDNTFCLALLTRLSSPLISTSVNISNEKPLTNIDSIINNEFANTVDAVFYSSIEKNPPPSTIVDLTDNHPRVLREGQINFMDIWRNLG